MSIEHSAMKSRSLLARESNLTNAKTMQKSIRMHHLSRGTSTLT